MDDNIEIPCESKSNYSFDGFDKNQKIIIHHRKNPFSKSKTSSVYKENKQCNIKCSLQKETSEYLFCKIISQGGDLNPINVEENTPKIKEEQKMFSDISLPHVREPHKKIQNQNSESNNIQNYSAKQQKEINDGFKMISTLPILNSSMFQDFQICLKQPQPDNNKKTLLLDLDETIIYTLQEGEISSDYQLQVETVNSFIFDNFKPINFIKRPYLLDFLREISKGFEIIIYTSSISNYANAIVNNIDPKKEYIQTVFTRANCFLVKDSLVKDVRIIKNRTPNNIIIVDNLISSFYSCLSNGIHIESFYGNKKDKELLKLLNILKSLENVEDVRVEIEKLFGLSKNYSSYLRNEKIRKKCVNSSLI